MKISGTISGVQPASHEGALQEIQRLQDEIMAWRNKAAYWHNKYLALQEKVQHIHEALIPLL